MDTRPRSVIDRLARDLRPGKMTAVSLAGRAFDRIGALLPPVGKSGVASALLESISAGMGADAIAGSFSGFCVQTASAKRAALISPIAGSRFLGVSDANPTRGMRSAREACNVPPPRCPLVTAARGA